jgi:hypothetical protein
MKYVLIYIFFLTSVFHTSCGQNQTNSPKDNINSETKGKVTSPGYNEKFINTKYEYTESSGARLIIQNSFPKSAIWYADPNGRKYIYAEFWTRIINETFDPLEVTIDFPVDSFQVPSSSGNFMKLLLSEQPFNDYGALKSFLDNNLHKSTSLKRTIHPKDSSIFYVVTLSLSSRGAGGISFTGMSGAIRTGFSIKEQNLFYSINGNEFPSGKINFKK